MLEGSFVQELKNNGMPEGTQRLCNFGHFKKECEVCISYIQGRR